MELVLWRSSLSASRTALLTGCYPNRVGILGALNHKSRIGISDRETTLGEVFKSRGYATAIFGKCASRRCSGRPGGCNG